MIITTLKQGLLLASTIAFVASNAFSQHAALCTEIEQEASTLFERPQLFRNDASSESCNIEFKRPDLSIDVEVSKTRSAARTEFDKTVRMFRFFRADTPLQDVEELCPQGIWDRAVVIIPNERGGSYVMVLSRKNYLITVLSESKQILSGVEKKLRDSFASFR